MTKYDFYYSAELESILKKNSDYIETRFNGKIFTEMILKNEKPLAVYDDNILIGTGTTNLVTYGKL